MTTTTTKRLLWIVNHQVDGGGGADPALPRPGGLRPGADDDPAVAMAGIRAAGFAPFVVARGDEEGGLSPLERDPAELEAGVPLIRRA